ncbi:MAG: PAS domain S-box protein [Sulfurimonas sp.]|nr:PAS domain S-box protein [Sulfurimonas sp.]
MKTVTVKEVQTSSFVKLSENEMLITAINTIISKRIHNLVIINNDKSYSSLSLSNILKCVSQDAWENQRISSLPKKVLKMIDEDTSTLEASVLMEDSDEILGVLNSDKEISGVISYQDITDSTHLRVNEFSDISISSLVLKNSASVASYNEKLSEIIPRLSESPANCLIVLKEGKPCGIITQRDIIRFIGEKRTLESSLEQYMTSPLFTVNGNFGISHALNMMQKHHYRRVVVLDAYGFLLGVITQKAILNIIYNYTAKKNWHSNMTINDALRIEVQNRTEELQKSKEKLEYLIKERTKELSQANKLLANIFETTHVFLAYLDRDFNFLKVNKAYADAHGHTAEYFVGKNYFTLYPDDEHKAIFQQVLNTGKEHNIHAKAFENKHNPPHKISYWDSNLRPIKDDYGYIESIVLTHIDVTLIINTKNSLHSTDLRYRTFFDLSPHGVLLVDIQTGLPLEFNDTACKQLGYTREEFKNLPISAYELNEDPEEVAAHMQKVIKTGRDEFETTHRKKNGEIINIAVITQYIKINQQEGFYTIFEDISEQKATQKYLENAKKTADEANEAKSTFLANMSHEIRTPMNAILGFLEILTQTSMSPEQARYLSKIDNASKALLSLLNDILDLSKIEAGKYKIMPCLFKPKELFTQSLELFEIEAAKKIYC